MPLSLPSQLSITFLYTLLTKFLELSTQATHSTTLLFSRSLLLSIRSCIPTLLYTTPQHQNAQHNPQNPANHPGPPPPLLPSNCSLRTCQHHRQETIQLGRKWCHTRRLKHRRWNPGRPILQQQQLLFKRILQVPWPP